MNLIASYPSVTFVTLASINRDFAPSDERHLEIGTHRFDNGAAAAAFLSAVTASGTLVDAEIEEEDGAPIAFAAGYALVGTGLELPEAA